MDGMGTRRLVKGLGAFSLGLGTAQLAVPEAMNRLIGAEDTARNRDRHRWVGGAREFGVGLGIASGRAPAVWLWSRVAGDMFDLGVLGRLLATRRRQEARQRAAAATAAVAGVAVADLMAALLVSNRPNHH